MKSKKILMRDLFTHIDAGYDGYMGLEFEAETDDPIGLPNINTMFWRTDKDPSLRGMFTAEYVTKKPVPYDKTKAVIGALFKDLQGFKPKPNSRTTSWHVHVNALKFTPREFITNLYTYWLLEPLLIHQCGDHRKQSTFALQLCDAQAMINSLNEDFYINLSRCPDDCLCGIAFNNEQRYGGQNLAAFRKFGSIEYRSMEGTLNRERIETWTDSLSKVWNLEPNFDNPDLLLDMYYDKGVDKVVTLVLGDVGERLMKAHLDKRVKTNIEDNALLLCSSLENVPYSWERIDSRIAKYVEKRKDVQLYKPQPKMVNLINGIPPAGDRRINVNDVQFEFNGAHWVKVNHNNIPEVRANV